MTLSLNRYLITMIEKKGSDLFVSSRLPVSAKINGELIPLGDDSLTKSLYSWLSLR
jgi:twitching motility protein PilU